MYETEILLKTKYFSISHVNVNMMFEIIKIYFYYVDLKKEIKIENCGIFLCPFNKKFFFQKLINCILLNYWNARFTDFDYNWRRWCELERVSFSNMDQENSSDQQESEDSIINLSDNRYNNEENI